MGGGGFLQRWSNATRGPRRQQFFPQPNQRRNGVSSQIGNLPGSWGQGGSFSNNPSPRPPSPQPPAPTSQPVAPPPSWGPNNGQSQVPYASNLENNLPLAQGSQRPFANPTSISSMITSLLYQSRQDPQDYWSNIFGIGRSSNQTYSGGTSGGTSSPYGNYSGGQPQTNQDRYPQGVNPWGYGEGSNYGDMGGASQQSIMSQSATQALQLSDAYFAPKRLELAYQLGDMETDMQRLAVNLGRQVDDPVLQAKLYKEAMQQVRTMDSDQNSFALQMTDQKSKEALQNQQFYDQLALEERKTQLQDDQFYASLKLQNKQLNMSQQTGATGG